MNRVRLLIARNIGAGYVVTVRVLACGISLNSRSVVHSAAAFRAGVIRVTNRSGTDHRLFLVEGAHGRAEFRSVQIFRPDPRKLMASAYF